jgi:hypothetical protein
MKLTDYLGFALFVGFGLWLVVSPTNVISFYTWFHNGKVKMPTKVVVRLVGAAWVVLVTIVMILAFTRH